ncbi:MAG: hypothetical protein ACOWWR_11545 [Eubacteriales bacterium]
MKKNYNKLVRDNIPKIIKNNGKNCTFKHLSQDQEFYNALLDKVIEEIEELRESSNEEELADIYEILDAVIQLKDFESMHIDYLKIKKKEARGSFHDRIFLQEVEE